jgi:hypothetical protein
MERRARRRRALMGVISLRGAVDGAARQDITLVRVKRK